MVDIDVLPCNAQCGSYQDDSRVITGEAELVVLPFGCACTVVVLQGHWLPGYWGWLLLVARTVVHGQWHWGVNNCGWWTWVIIV